MSADQEQIVTGLDEGGNPVKMDVITEEEYAAREAARPPAITTGQVGTVVKTEAELRAALPGGGLILVHVEGILPLTTPEVVKLSAPGTVLCGLGKNVTTLETKIENPNNISFWPAAKNITIRDITLDSGPYTWHCVYGDCNSNPSGLVLDNVRIQNCNDGFKYVGAISQPPCMGLTFKNSEIIDFKGRGIFWDCDISDPVVENFYLRGTGNDLHANTGIWIGQGILGGRIVNGKIEHCAMNGLEVFYSHSYATKSQLTRDNPFGAGPLIRGIEIVGVTNIACSLAGTKRSVVSDIFIRKSGAGMEYIDEIIADPDGKPLYSDYNAHNVTVAECSNVGVTIHRLKRGRFSNHVITDCAMFGVQIYNGADDIIFEDSSLAKCADAMLFCNTALNTTIRNNEFFKKPGDPANSGFHAFNGGRHIFTGNTLHGGLKSTVDRSTVLVAPGVSPSVSGGVFTDSYNYRFA